MHTFARMAEIDRLPLCVFVPRCVCTMFDIYCDSLARRLPSTHSCVVMFCVRRIQFSEHSVLLSKQNHFIRWCWCACVRPTLLATNLHSYPAHTHTHTSAIISSIHTRWFVSFSQSNFHSFGYWIVSIPIGNECKNKISADAMTNSSHLNDPRISLSFNCSFALKWINFIFKQIQSKMYLKNVEFQSQLRAYNV